MINFDRLNNKICLDLSHTFCMTSINVSICSQYLLIFHQHWHSFTCRRPTVLWSFSLQNTNFSRTLTTLNTACTSLFEHLIWSSSLQNCLSVVPTFVISQLTRDFFSLSDLAISKDAANLISKVENTNWKGTLWKINSRRCKYYQRKIKVFLSKTIDTSKPIILSRQGWVHILLRQVDNNSQSLLFFCATTTINILKMPAFVLLPLTSITIRCSSTSCMCSIMNEFTSTFWLYVRRRLALDWPLSRNIGTTRTLICENYWITVLQNERFSLTLRNFVKTVCRLMYY